MTGWIIFGSNLLFLILLLICPVWLSVRLGDQNKVTAGYLFIRFPLYPRVSKKNAAEKKAKKEAKKQAKQESKQAKLEKEHAKATTKETIDMLLDLAKASASPLFHLLKRTYLMHLDLRVEVGGEDAADIALNATKIRIAVAYFVGLFKNLRLLKRMRHAAVVPNFLKEETEYRVRFCIMIRLGTILYAALAAGIKFLIRTVKRNAEDASLEEMPAKENSDQSKNAKSAS